MMHPDRVSQYTHRLSLIETPACYILFTIVMTACTHQAPPYTAPLPHQSTAESLIEHATISGTLQAFEQPTGSEFRKSFLLGTLLGPVGLAIGIATADADPPDRPILPTPRYADTSATYILAYRRAYDAQLKSERRGAAVGGGVFGMLVNAGIWVAVITNAK